MRRAFLCGVDAYSANNYEHRREWIQKRLAVISRAFAVDIAAYAVMSNHLHLVCCMQPERLTFASDEDIVDRYLMVFPGFREEAPNSNSNEAADPDRNDFIQYKRREYLNNAERIATFRKRLTDLSWLMRALAQPLAQWSNKEDQVTGRF